MSVTIRGLIQRKRELGLTNERIAELSGVPLGTVMKIFSGATKSPRYQTMQQLENALFPAEGPHGAEDGKGSGTLEGAESGSHPSAGGTHREIRYTDLADRVPQQNPTALRVYDSASRPRREGMAGETAPAYYIGGTSESDGYLKGKRKYTVDDYYAFKDDKRRELIDGRIFVMEAPSLRHQLIIGELYILFRECIRLHGKKCRVFLSPCDVQLDRDKYTMVQPDILIVCDEEKLTAKVCYGAPDLAVEIMSPSSRSRDAVLKLNKYMHAGVREYWLVDPENRSVTVYRRDAAMDAGEENNSGTDGKKETSEGTFHLYSFSDTIPIGLSGGECAVDFSVVEEALRGVPE